MAAKTAKRVKLAKRPEAEMKSLRELITSSTGPHKSNAPIGGRATLRQKVAAKFCIKHTSTA